MPDTIQKAKNFMCINPLILTYELSNISIFCHLRDEPTEVQSGYHLAEEELGFQPGHLTPESTL